MTALRTPSWEDVSDNALAAGHIVNAIRELQHAAERAASPFNELLAHQAEVLTGVASLIFPDPDKDCPVCGAELDA